MNCQDAKELMHAYVDGELDLVKTLDIENHIRDCRECAAAHRSLLALRASIRDGALGFKAPATLELKIRSQIKQAQAARAGRGWALGRWAGAAALVALTAGTVWLVLGGSGNGPDRQLVMEVTSAHVRSLMAEHLWDVKSTDRHTVKPWFDGKLDFAPDVRDFKNESFALEGGRLDYLAGRPVAALVYRHDKHSINLFTWPAPGQADAEPLTTASQGYVLVHWRQAGMNYWAAADTSEDLLRHFAELVRHRDPETRPTTSFSR